LLCQLLKKSWRTIKGVDNRLHRHASEHRLAFTGLALCVLAVVFAFSAKLAWYRTGPPAHAGLASMKASKAAPLLVSAPVLQSPFTPAAAALPVACALLMAFAFVLGAPRLREQFPLRATDAIHPRTIARPPPAR
jgi:hypothetical protein